MQVLIVDDEAECVASLSQRLRQQGHETIDVDTGEQALKNYHMADLILLDLDLPDIDGLEVCRSIRAACDIPIIAFTDRGAELDRVLGLQAGSDDCMVKPYGFRELIARIDAVMRRVRPRLQGWPTSRLVITRGPLRIDTAMRTVRLGGEPLKVTRKEFDLLHYLASRPDMVVSREELMAEVWGVPIDHTFSVRASRTIDTHVSTLRNKLGANSWIITVHGVGFQFGHG